MRLGLAADAGCRLCQDPSGTLWHRRYECPAFAALRRDWVTPALLRAAKGARDTGPAVAETFARGLFPDPGPLFRTDAPRR